MRRLSKKGIELSVNFLVMLIVSLVLFGMSLYFINSFRQIGAGYEADLGRYAVDQLRQLSRGSAIALFPETVDARVGDPKVVGVGVTNVGDSTVVAKLQVDAVAAYDVNGDTLKDSSSNDIKGTGWVSFIAGDSNGNTQYSIPAGDFRSFVLIVNPKSGAVPGTYEFDVCMLTATSVTACSVATVDQLYPKGVIKSLKVVIS